MLLKDKVAVITGGAGINGLGYATARQMAAQGARVVILDLARAEPATAAARLGEGHLGLVADVTDKAACEAAAAAVLKAYGRIDILVNNAGITQPVKTLEITGADYDRILDVSLRGTLYMSQAVLPAMLERGDGTIVDVASVAGLAPTPGMWGYNASKAGLAAASESLRGELRSTGVHVVTVYPGPVDTPMARAGYAAYPESPMLRVLPEGIPSELARLIRSAVDLKRARVIYPWPYSILRYFPAVARWFLDRLTPRPFSRQKP